jgi:hypothetical protein
VAGTILVAVRNAVIEGVKYEPDFSRTSTNYAWKAGDKSRVKIFTRRGRINHESASMKAGRTFRNETGYFDLVILVEGVSQAQEVTSQEAADLGLLLEEFIADHRNALDIPGLKWIAVEGDGELSEALNDKGTLAELSYTVTYNARLE